MAIKPTTADIYHGIRRTIFETFIRDPYTAYDYLDGYQQTLGAQVHQELIAELEFYGKYKDEYQLKLTDGNKEITDFTGKMDGASFRFDVTTNDFYQQLPEDDPFQKGEYKYRIAVVEKDTGALKEFVEINFPYCDKCGDGRLYDFAILLTGKGGGFSQAHVSHCPSCSHTTEIQRLNDPSLVDFATYRQRLEEENQRRAGAGEEPLDIATETSQYAMRTARYLKYAFDRILVGIGANKFEVTDPTTNSGYLESYLEWRNKDISRVIPLEFGMTLAE